MANCRFDNLWSSAANDGASCPIGVSGDRSSRNADSEVEVDQLLDAWFHERTDRIECSLILEQARKLLSDLLADGQVSPRKRREACRMIRAIKKQLRNESGGHSP